MRSCGQNPSEAEIQVATICHEPPKKLLILQMRCWSYSFFQDMVIQVDKDGTGSLDFPEFLMMMAQKVKDNTTTYKICHIFKI